MPKKNKKELDVITYFTANKKLLVIIGIVIVVALLYLLMPRSPKAEKCNDLDCFITNANECNSTTYLETSEIGTIKYSIANNCTLTKEIVELSENEDPFLKKALQGKKMECIYSKGNFNGQWIISLIEGLEDCQGDLKEAIANLLLTV